MGPEAFAWLRVRGCAVRRSTGAAALPALREASRAPDSAALSPPLSVPIRACRALAHLQPGAWMYAVMASLPVSRCAAASALVYSLDCKGAGVGAEAGAVAHAGRASQALALRRRGWQCGQPAGLPPKGSADDLLLAPWKQGPQLGSSQRPHTLMTAFLAASATLHSRVQEERTPSRPARPACGAAQGGEGARWSGRAAET